MVYNCQNVSEINTCSKTQKITTINFRCAIVKLNCHIARQLLVRHCKTTTLQDINLQYTSAVERATCRIFSVSPKSLNTDTVINRLSQPPVKNSTISFHALHQITLHVISFYEWSLGRSFLAFSQIVKADVLAISASQTVVTCNISTLFHCTHDKDSELFGSRGVSAV